MDKPAFSEEREVVATKGVKLRNKPRTPTKAEQQQQMQERLETLAQKTINKDLSRNDQMFLLAKQYMGHIKNKQLASNKGEIGKEVENATITGLVQLAIETNNDDSEQMDGMGSVALANFLLKVILVQRDHINDLDYRLHKLEKNESSNGV